MDRLTIAKLIKERNDHWDTLTMDEKCVRAPKIMIDGIGPFVEEIYYDQLLDLARREVKQALSSKDSGDA